MFRLEFGIHLQGDTGVFIRGPRTYRHNAGSIGNTRNNGEDEQGGGAGDQSPPVEVEVGAAGAAGNRVVSRSDPLSLRAVRSEEHTSELQPRETLVCRLLVEKK